MRQRIVFKIGETEYNIGYTEWASISYQGNISSRIIPRAKGVKLYSTEEMGGGIKEITIYAYIIKNSRLEVEQYLNTLIDNIANKKGDLIIEGTLTLSDCYLESLRSDSDYKKWNYFDISFKKSL